MKADHSSPAVPVGLASAKSPEPKCYEGPSHELVEPATANRVDNISWTACNPSLPALILTTTTTTDLFEGNDTVIRKLAEIFHIDHSTEERNSYPYGEG